MLREFPKTFLEIQERVEKHTGLKKRLKGLLNACRDKGKERTLDELEKIFTLNINVAWMGFPDRVNFTPSSFTDLYLLIAFEDYKRACSVTEKIVDLSKELICKMIDNGTSEEELLKHLQKGYDIFETEPEYE